MGSPPVWRNGMCERPSSFFVPPGLQQGDRPGSLRVQGNLNSVRATLVCSKSILKDSWRRSITHRKAAIWLPRRIRTSFVSGRLEPCGGRARPKVHATQGAALANRASRVPTSKTYRTSSSPQTAHAPSFPYPDSHALHSAASPAGPFRHSRESPHTGVTTESGTSPYYRPPRHESAGSAS